MNNMNELIQIGMIPKEILNDNERQRRVYSTNGISSTILSRCDSCKIAVKKEKRMKEFKNRELIKYNFNMDTIRVFDVFAGIGALHQSLKELGIPTKITNISEIDIDAIISYAGIHIENFINLDFEYPSDEKMREWLIGKNIGWDFKKQKSLIPRLKKDKLNKVYKASILLNNLGDISKIDYDNMEDFDLFNFSFPCTDISNAGQQKGLKNEDGTPTRSGLVVYGLKAIRSKKPKFIMIENVKGLIQRKFIDDFYDIIKELENIGYKCYYPTKEDKKKGQVPTCLNAKDYGIPQNRERIYVICVRSDVELNMIFPKGFDNGIRLKDFLEDSVEEKYYLDKPWHFSTDLDDKHDTNEIAQIEGISYKAIRTICDSEKLCRCLDTMGGGQREPKIIDNKFFIDKHGRKLDVKQSENYIQWDTSGKGYSSQVDRAFYEDGIVGTIPAMNPQDKTQVIENDIRIRKLTPKECWRLMGFRDACFEKAKELGISDSQLYKQAGNSIVVNVLYYIFKELFKDYIIR